MKEKLYWLGKGLSEYMIVSGIIWFILLAISDGQGKIHPDGFPSTPWWEYALILLGVIISFFFLFFFEELEEREKRNKNKIKIRCQCGSWFEELITKQDRKLNGKNTICPFCEAIMWIPIGQREKFITFFKQKGGEYREYKSFC